MSENYGKRLMPGVLVQEACNDPLRVFASIAKSAEPRDGFQDVTFQQVAAAVDEVVHLLQQQLGHIDHNSTIAYVGIPDLRYNIFFYAALKCRMKVFLPSPRNPVAVNKSLLEQTHCRTFVFTPETAPVANGLKAAITDLACFQLPTLDTLLDARPDPLPYDLDFTHVKDEPILILHSSGSTGVPKPVTMTHASFAVVDNDRNFPNVPGRRNHDLTSWDFPHGGRLYAPFPPFHLAGFFNTIMVPLFSRTIPVLGPPLRLPTGGLVADILRSQHIRGCFLPPSVTVDLYNQPDGPDLLKHLDILCYAGGPLAESIGNELVKHVTLCQFYGSTEIGQVRQLLPRKENWQYMEFHPYSKHELQPADDGAYELVVYADDSTMETSAFNHNYPDVREHRTKDLFLQHPTQPGLWKFHARRDDILVLSSGEKLNPLSMEGGISALPGIAGAVVVGDGQPRVGLLVELASRHQFGDDPIAAIWPSVSALNAELPSHGRIAKSMIRITDPKKLFVRAGKGTVVRKLTLAAYEEEIKDLFKGSSSTRTLQPTAYRADDVSKMVHSIFQDVLERSLAENDDFIAQGLDSIKSMEALDLIKSSVPGDVSWLSLDTIYSYPTIRQLSSIIIDWLNHGKRPKLNRAQRIKETLAGYVERLLAATRSHEKVVGGRMSIVLIGSTGYLGRYLLDTLTREPQVARIWCLNRSPTARQQAGDSLSDKVEFHQVKFLEIAFGLPTDVYEQLETCHAIIHSAWQVNFVLPLSSFRDSLQGLKNTIDLATVGKHGPRLLFISSISATGVSSERGSTKRIVPEAPVANIEDAMHTGYGESKLVAERLIAEATARSGVQASIIRFGQVAPPFVPPFEWPAADSLLTVLQTSKAVCTVPDNLLNVHWIPVDSAASIVKDILYHSSEKSLDFYNAVNPTTTYWSDLVSVIQNWCDKETSVCSLKEWVEVVEREALKYTGEPLQAMTLISFFKLLSNRGEDNAFSQDHLLEVSETARGMPPVDARLLEQWLAILK